MFRFRHPTWKPKRAVVPTPFENVAVRDGIAECNRPVTCGHLEDDGWFPIDDKGEKVDPVQAAAERRAIALGKMKPAAPAKIEQTPEPSAEPKAEEEKPKKSRKSSRKGR